MIYTISASLTKVKNKPNSNPKQTQSKPILGQYQGWQSQNKPKTKPICILAYVAGLIYTI
jgi:hypothetical protein